MTPMTHRTEVAIYHARHATPQTQSRPAYSAITARRMEAAYLLLMKPTAQEIEQDGLTPYQQMLYGALDTPKTSVELAKITGKSTPSVCSVLKNMHRTGLVTFRKSGHLNIWSRGEGKPDMAPQLQVEIAKAMADGLWRTTDEVFNRPDVARQEPSMSSLRNHLCAMHRAGLLAYEKHFGINIWRLA